MRFSSYFGKDKFYITAPAILTSGARGPHVIFIENIPENIDTFRVRKPQVNSVNLIIDLSYQFSKKITAGFNIDLIGFSFGAKRGGMYINGALQQKTTAEVSHFNLLLVSDNDLGMLNSQLYCNYFLNDKLAIRAGPEFLFTEYTTAGKV